MPRRVQDIVPNSHRSIRDIPLHGISVERNKVTAPIQPPKEKEATKNRAQPSDMRPSSRRELTVKEASGRSELEHRKKISKADEEVPTEDHKRAVTTVSHRKSKKSRPRKWLYVLMGIVIIVAGVAYVASVFFSHASFTIVSKVVPVTVNSTYISQNASNPNGLTYELATVKGGSSAIVPATDGSKISTSAKGTITLYNSYTSQSQRLIAGTRMTDGSDRIYRLASSVVIPGYAPKSGVNVPGTVTASIIADQPGQKYNISRSDPVSDFKIVAYQGSAKYDAIYGRLISDVSGGFIGTQKTITPAILASTTAELQDKITASLLAQVKETLPQGYIMYPNAYVISFSKPATGGTDAKSATVSINGTLHGILFKKNDLVLRVAGGQALATFESFPYEASGLESLDFSIANQKDFSADKKNTLIIKLKGEAKLIGSIPVDTLKKKLSGMSLSETEAVLRSYKPVIDIDSSSGEITPPWSKVPSDPGRIDIKVLTK